MTIVPASTFQTVTVDHLDALRALWPNPHRLALAFRLAPDVEACEDLLRGVGVGPERLDPAGLAWARQRMLVQLSPALDLLAGVAA